MAVAGDKLSVGDGFICASDTTASDIDEWAAEATTVFVEIKSIHVTSTVEAVSHFSVTNAAGGHLLQAQMVNWTSPIDIVYARDAMPRLNGLTIDSPTVGASATFSYSIIYRVTTRTSI